MESQPPNDPNNNRNNNHQMRNKEMPYDGRSGRNQRQRQGDEVMDVMGDMRDSPAVVIMMLVGIASWLLRERCVC